MPPFPNDPSADARHVLERISDGFYAVDRDWRIVYVNAQAERMVSRDRAGLLGRVFWDAFPEMAGSPFERACRRAMAEQTPVTFEAFYSPYDAWFEARAHPSPDGLSVYFRDITARKATEGEQRRAQDALAREAQERLARAEREALLSRIGFALRASSDPEQVLETAVRELGEALKADRCYYAAYDQDADTATMGPDWCRAGLLSLSGQYAMSQYAVNRDPEYRAGRTQVVADTSRDRAILDLGIRALVRVPLVAGAAMTALSAAMTDGPRAWTPDEVSLVEAVATQTQTALEAVRVQRRERNIAQQLQAALTPAVPQHVAGMVLAKHYEAALDEAGVGGDFYDVFPVDKGCTALIVGDLSGKGLAAASQVAMVRNMLRYALYRARTLAGALDSLNSLLAEQSLLTGFATLFVGAFDSATGTLTYVNAGQEPALVRRAAGEIEMLPPTGPVLGSIEGAAYEEQVVVLKPGDALALFTDGLTEVGPSRLKMLGIEGVTALFGRPVPPEAAQGTEAMAEFLAARLIDGVDTAAAGGVMRDDVCLLIAVVEG